MREILFRGKRVNGGEWAEGYFTKKAVGKFDQKTYSEVLKDFIITDFSSRGIAHVEVLPKTVGQFTGLIDKNGTNIFEGDILSFEDTGEEGYEYKEGFEFQNSARVEFLNGRFQLTNFLSDNSGVLEDMGSDHDDFISLFEISEVIGNIHDSPELLGGDGS